MSRFFLTLLSILVVASTPLVSTAVSDPAGASNDGIKTGTNNTVLTLDETKVLMDEVKVAMLNEMKVLMDEMKDETNATSISLNETNVLVDEMNAPMVSMEEAMDEIMRKVKYIKGMVIIIAVVCILFIIGSVWQQCHDLS